MKLFDGFYAYPWEGNDNNCSSYVFGGVLKEGKHVVVDPGHLITPYYREAGLERLMNAQWLEKLAKIRESNEPRLERLRSDLLQELKKAASE